MLKRLNFLSVYNFLKFLKLSYERETNISRSSTCLYFLHLFSKSKITQFFMIKNVVTDK